ncbi:hypothetical protein BJI48_05960 [Helicobacter sp. 11S02596-1]|nr:hypothetical protein BJI48_05960 [Helicobacter sp. 11S02596-1]
MDSGGKTIEFLDFVKNLIISPPEQVFLMGDVFHLFLGHLPSSQKENAGLIALINALSEKTEVFYFEGNHDFGINSVLLPCVKLYPRSLQPALFLWEGRRFFLAHGDIFITKTYECYIRTMTSPLVLSLLKLLDRLSLGVIYAKVSKKIQKKPIKLLQMDGGAFEKFALERFEKYSQFAKKNNLGFVGGVIEGHFHIGKKLDYYISLPSFYCEKRAFIIQSNQKS